MNSRQKKSKKHFVLIALIIASVLLLFAAILSLLDFRLLNQAHQVGPELENFQVTSLDRNNNGKPDTLRFDFVVNSDRKIILFGSTRLCVGNDFFRFSCKFISTQYKEPTTDGFGHDLLEVGENHFSRYLYFDKIPTLFSKANWAEVYLIGDNPAVVYRFKKIEPAIDVRNFEVLPFGEQLIEGDSYSDSRLLKQPIE